MRLIIPLIFLGLFLGCLVVAVVLAKKDVLDFDTENQCEDPKNWKKDQCGIWKDDECLKGKITAPGVCEHDRDIPVLILLFSSLAFLLTFIVTLILHFKGK